MKRTLCIFVTLLLVSLVSCTWDVSMPRRDPEFETIPQEYRGYWIAQPGDETADRFAIYEDRIEYYCPLGEYSITLDARVMMVRSETVTIPFSNTPMLLMTTRISSSISQIIYTSLVEK